MNTRGWLAGGAVALAALLSWLLVERLQQSEPARGPAQDAPTRAPIVEAPEPLPPPERVEVVMPETLPHEAEPPTKAPVFDAAPLVAAGVDPEVAVVMARASQFEWEFLEQTGVPQSRTREFYFAIWPSLPQLLAEHKVTMESWTQRRGLSAGLEYWMHTSVELDEHTFTATLRGPDRYVTLKLVAPVGDQKLWDAMFAPPAK